MIAKCLDNSHTWRCALTINKNYSVIKIYNDPYAGYEMIEVTCDDDEIRRYRANRFQIFE